MNRIPILHVVNDGHWGGVIAVTTPILRALAQQDFAVYVICGSEGEGAEALRREGFSVGIIDLTGSLVRMRPIIELIHFIRAHDIQMIHAHHGRAYLRARLAARWTGVPVVTTFHGLPMDELDERGVSGIKRGYYMHRERWLARFDAAMIALTTTQRHRLQAAGINGRIEVIPNGISTAKYADCRHNDTESPPIILACGRLVKGKGIHILIRALPRVRQAVAGARLWIAGDGEERLALEAEARRCGVADATHFLGYCADIRPLLSAASIVALPSRREGLCTTVLEAMAAGRPVIGSDIPGINCLLTHGETGWLCPPADVEFWAEALIHLLAHANVCQRLAENAISAVEEKYDQRVTIDKMIALYMQLLAERRIAADERREEVAS